MCSLTAIIRLKLYIMVILLVRIRAIKCIDFDYCIQPQITDLQMYAFGSNDTLAWLLDIMIL